MYFFVFQDNFNAQNSWQKLRNMEVRGFGSYVKTTNFQKGQFIAGVTGVYYLSANIIFQDPNGPISIIISLNGDNSRRRSLYATKGNPASIKDSLSVAGSLFIRKGKWKNLGDKNLGWQLYGDNTLSGILYGDKL